MKRTSKRVWSALAALLVAASIAPVLSAPAASAAGVLQGKATIKVAGGASNLNAGDSGTAFTLRLPSGAACGGDSANDGYRVNSYIVPVTVDPASLTWNSSGPIPAGTGAALRQPLFDTNGTPYVNAQTANAVTPPGPGPIVNIPDFKFAVFSPGNIPSGQYHVGIACTLGVASSTQMKEYWDVIMSFTAPGGGPASVNWTAGAPATNGCKNSTVASAEIGHYPAQPASQSSLRVSCTFSNNTSPGTNEVSAKFRLNDFPVAEYHNGAARTVTNSIATPVGLVITTATCQGMGAYVNRGITTVGGVAGIPARTFVKSVTGSGPCSINLSNATTAIIPVTTSFKIDNVDGPRSRVDVHTTSGSTTITSATANFQTSTDVGLSVSGTELVPGTTIASVTNATTAVVSIAALATNATGATVSFGGTKLSSTTRQVNDAGITSATVINSAAAKWNATDVGLKVTGTGIPANTFILSVSGTNATTTGGMTITAAPINVVVGDPSATAPNGTEQVGIQGVQLDLNPALVPGTEDCGYESAEGFATVARWNNPGSFTGSVLYNTQPTGTKAIGQIYFDTSVADFSAFVVETNTPLGPGSFSYSLVFPNVPTTSAMCPGTVSSPGLGFSLSVQAQTLSIAALPSGTGRPGTAQVRSIIPSAYVAGLQQGYAAAATLVSDDPLITFAPASEFTRTCVYPSGAVAVNFKCGNG